MAMIIAERDGKCRRCKRDFKAGEQIWYAKGQPIFCTRPDCAPDAERVVESARSYSFQRGEQSGVSYSAQSHGTRPPAADDPRQQPAAAAAAAPAAAPPLATLFREQQQAFREQQLSDLLDRLLPLLRELRAELLQRQPQ